MERKLSPKSKLHLAKMKMAAQRAIVLKRRLETFEKIEPLIEHQKDREHVAIALLGIELWKAYELTKTRLK